MCASHAAGTVAKMSRKFVPGSEFYQGERLTGIRPGPTGARGTAAGLYAIPTARVHSNVGHAAHTCQRIDFLHLHNGSWNTIRMIFSFLGMGILQSTQSPPHIKVQASS